MHTGCVAWLMDQLHGFHILAGGIGLFVLVLQRIAAKRIRYVWSGVMVLILLGIFGISVNYAFIFVFRRIKGAKYSQKATILAPAGVSTGFTSI